MAEAELLAPLGELLMPNMRIGEMFRSFKSPAGWGGNYLEPDLTAFGLLKEKDAALFVEYDGYYRHATKVGMEKDLQKNAALLEFAPAGSFVVRIGHTGRTEFDGNVLWISIKSWRKGDYLSVTGALKAALEETVPRLQAALRPDVQRSLEAHLDEEQPLLISQAALEFREAVVMGRGNTAEEISLFLSSKGFRPTDIHRMQKRALGSAVSIEKSLQPLLQFLFQLGLAKTQSAKAIATFPPILGYRVEEKLKPTAQWFVDLGLTKCQLAKVVTKSPSILGLSIQQNLQPTVQWFQDLGLTRSQLAKAVGAHPGMLMLSIEQNLKPTVQWFVHLGLTKHQVAKSVARFAPILWYSIEQNLKPTVAFFGSLGLTHDQVAKVVVTFPPILGLSLQQNLKPTVQWLLNLGLSQSQVAKAVATFPNLLSFSVPNNLTGKVKLLQSFLRSKDAVDLIAKWPVILSYRQQRLEERLNILASQDSLGKVVSAMSLTDEKFHKRFLAQKPAKAYCLVVGPGRGEGTGAHTYRTRGNTWDNYSCLFLFMFSN